MSGSKSRNAGRILDTNLGIEVLQSACNRNFVIGTVQASWFSRTHAFGVLIRSTLYIAGRRTSPCKCIAMHTYIVCSRYLFWADARKHTYTLCGHAHTKCTKCRHTYMYTYMHMHIILHKHVYRRTYICTGKHTCMQTEYTHANKHASPSPSQR